MKRLIFIINFLLLTTFVLAQEIRPVKNVIVMIPDGTSIGVVSAARWFKIYNKLGDNLNIDPYLCGTVSTFSSNAPIGDSGPTTSCYMTGIPQQAGNISIYPKVSPGDDLYPLDSSMTYQPLVTILEAMKIEQKKAVGLVVTCEFPHATPADCASHYYDRNNYNVLSRQMAYNNLDVMFGGGTAILTEDIKQYFKHNGTTLIEDNKSMLMTTNAKRVWALFGKKAQPYDLDRNPNEVPSLSEMTEKALEILSKNPNGFFLMIEGSKVDWAAHSNDPIGMITEFLAFDKAVGVVMEFAKKNGETAVIILPDHGNSGFTIGSYNCKGTDKLTLSDLFATVSQYKLTAVGLEDILINTKPENVKSEFKKYTNIELTNSELDKLLLAKNYKWREKANDTTLSNLKKYIAEIMNLRTCFGFTTGGHTGEEVFLAAYHPNKHIPIGHLKNTDINNYLFKVAGLKTPLLELTKQVFAKHTEVFADAEYNINKKDCNVPILTVTKGKNILQIQAFSSVATLNGKTFDIGSVAVYIDKKEMFYLPRNLAEKLK